MTEIKGHYTAHPPAFTWNNNEPLSTKQLRERIGKEHGTHYDGCWQDHPTCLLVRLLDEIDKQNMTIDRLLADKSHYMEVVRRLYDDIEARKEMMNNYAGMCEGYREMNNKYKEMIDYYQQPQIHIDHKINVK